MGLLKQGYKDPTGGSNYMKLQQGENKIRILTEPLMGWEYWTEDNEGKKVTRVREFKDVPMEVRSSTDPQAKAKYFWALLVWSYADEQAQVLTLTQASIRKAIAGLDEDPDWGDAREYDLSIKKSGEKLETEYQVNPKPKAKFVEKGKDIPTVNLEALFDNADPFAVAEEPKKQDAQALDVPTV